MEPIFVFHDNQLFFVPDTSRLPPYSMFAMYELTKVYICSSIRIICVSTIYTINSMCMYQVPVCIICAFRMHPSCCPMPLSSLVVSKTTTTTQQQDTPSTQQSTTTAASSSINSSTSYSTAVGGHCGPKPPSHPPTHPSCNYRESSVVVERESNGYRPENGVELRYDK